jgi:hypothetical protein
MSLLYFGIRWLTRPRLSIVTRTSFDRRALDRLAREVFDLFPTCVRCGRRIERYEDADVRIFTFRVQHRQACGGGDDVVHRA